MDGNIIAFPKSPSFNRQRLTEARLSCELTQTELAKRVGVSIETISNLESGQRNPGPETLALLCEELGFPSSYFSQKTESEELESPVFFRDRASKTKRQNLRLDVWRKWGARMLKTLTSNITLPAVKLPKVEWSITPPSDLIEWAEALASECRRTWGLGDGPISNLVRLAEAMGVCVIRLNLEGMDQVDGFSCWQDGRPFVFLLAKQSAARERFNLAHELLHLIAHRGIAIEDMDAEHDRMENEAHAFGGALILPRTTYAKEVVSFSVQHFTRLKERWGASIAAQGSRCKAMGLMDDERFLQFRKNLSWNKITRKEPLDNVMKPEIPSMLRQAITLLSDNSIVHGWQIADSLALKPEKMANLTSAPIELFESPKDQSEIRLLIK